jgi:hypothetical protein
VVCGLWFVVCGLWFVVCGLWFVVCGLWFMDCEVIATTNQLVNCKIYEFLLKKVLKEDIEFFNVEIDMIKEIFETFNYIN